VKTRRHLPRKGERVLLAATVSATTIEVPSVMGSNGEMPNSKWRSPKAAATVSSTI
jgi:hypothetical protein